MSYWKLIILAINIYRLITHFKFCKYCYFEFSGACKIMQQFLALRSRAFCGLINWNHFVNLCLYVKTVLRCLFFLPTRVETQARIFNFYLKQIIIKIIWKILFSWNIICLRRFYLTMKISNFLWMLIFFHD